MNEILLTLIILILCGILVGSYYISWKEREKLLKMFMAKDLREITDNEALEKLPKQEELKESELVNMDDVIENEALFDKHLAAVRTQAKEEFEKGQEIT